MNTARAGRNRLVIGGAVSVLLLGLSVVTPTSAGATTTWSLASSPNVGARHNDLSAVSCVSPASCTAVGSYVNTSGVRRTLIESWNGSSWSRLSSPNAGLRNNDLYSVSCVSPSSCTAVGYYVNTGGIDRTLIVSWNGSSWSRLSSPNAGIHDNFLQRVSCVSATSCTAVGVYFNTSGIGRTLIESWNGSSWSRVSSPNAGTRDNFLNGVSCVSATSCVAAGFYWNGSAVRTLIVSWNGSSWSRLSSPNAGIHDNAFNDVSCVSATSCTAVGTYRNTSGIKRTLVETWNGTSWSQVSSPNAGTHDNDFYGVSCVSPVSCKAVGYYVNTSRVHRNLIASDG